MIPATCCNNEFRFDPNDPNGPTWHHDVRDRTTRATRRVSHCPTCGDRLDESAKLK